METPELVQVVSSCAMAAATIVLVLVTYLYLKETRKMVSAANGPNIKCRFGDYNGDFKVLFIENLSTYPLNDFSLNFIDTTYQFKPYFGDEALEESFLVMRNIAQGEEVMYPLEFHEGVRYINIQMNYTYNNEKKSQKRKLYYQFIPTKNTNT